MKEPIKMRRGVFISKQKKKGRGNPNYFVSIPQEGEPTEHDAGLKYCWNCQKEMSSINKWIKDVEVEGGKTESMWLRLCKKCGFCVEDGMSVTDVSTTPFITKEQTS